MQFFCFFLQIIVYLLYTRAIIMQKTFSYLLSFLLGDETLTQFVGYTADKSQWQAYKIVIVPSSFFKDHQNGCVKLPALPLSCFNKMPILFGQSASTMEGDTLVVYADLLASACFYCRDTKKILSKRGMNTAVLWERIRCFTRQAI